VAAEKAVAEQRMRTYGSPIDVEPHVALIEEVRRTAGHVAWLNEWSRSCSTTATGTPRASTTTASAPCGPRPVSSRWT
jgi:hypothetical protein